MNGPRKVMSPTMGERVVLRWNVYAGAAVVAIFLVGLTMAGACATAKNGTGGTHPVPGRCLLPAMPSRLMRAAARAAGARATTTRSTEALPAREVAERRRAGAPRRRTTPEWRARATTDAARLASA
jgi:hypothetical protein